MPMPLRSVGIFQTLVRGQTLIWGLTDLVQIYTHKCTHKCLKGLINETQRGSELNNTQTKW